MLAFDFGTKSIGVAYGQGLTGSGEELAPLRARDGVPEWRQVEALIATWQPRTLLVGLPLNMDGSEGELARLARKFSRKLEGRFNLPAVMVDERLTTRSAKQEAYDRGHRGNFAQRPIDSIAARLLLEAYFAEAARADG